MNALCQRQKAWVNKMTTSDLTHRLYRKFDTSEDAITAKYIVATQVRANGSATDRTADAIIVGNWPSVGYEIQGFEIKISRADWLNELKDMTKHQASKQYCDRWWLLIASELFVKEGELPEDWGLMVPHGTGIRIVKAAPKLEPKPASVQFITGLMRANKRNHVSEDLHAQYIQDNNRAIEAKLRKEFDGLQQSAKFIHEAFGIELKKEEKWLHTLNNGRGGYEKYWIAKIRNRYHTYTDQALKELIELVLSGDLNKARYELGQAFDDIENATEILEKYKGLLIWKMN